MNYNRKVNSIIDQYKKEEIYSKLKSYYSYLPIDEKKYNEKITAIKEILENYYLQKYRFKSYSSDEPQDKLIETLREGDVLSKKIRFEGNSARVYPVTANIQEREMHYKEVVSHMVEYHINTGESVEQLLPKYTYHFETSLKQYKDKLKSLDMKPYYGLPDYMIKRAEFINECIKQIPDIDYNIDNIVQKMETFNQKHVKKATGFFSQYEDYVDVEDSFYRDYDTLEEYYKLVLDIENNLSPIVVKHWKEYLTNPDIHDSNHYKYIMHTFSDGLVDPNQMRKACCALNTDELVITPYGGSGLIYQIDKDSLETACCEDAGSWTCTKQDFIDQDCPGRWQLVNPNEPSVWYESENNSKLIMPQDLEKECMDRSLRLAGEILNNEKGVFYSEIYLNKNAKPVGVFYNDNCDNIEEVREYAEKYDLPLINISLKKQRELKGLEPLEKEK